MRITAIQKKRPFPCIAFWDYSHFVVIRDMGKKSVFINDPAGGELKISVDDFIKVIPFEYKHILEQERMRSLAEKVQHLQIQY